MNKCDCNYNITIQSNGNDITDIEEVLVVPPSFLHLECVNCGKEKTELAAAVVLNFTSDMNKFFRKVDENKPNLYWDYYRRYLIFDDEESIFE